MHSFRHSMRDRLKAVQCPADITDQIGGWTTGGIGQEYGLGYPMSVLKEWLARVEFFCLSSGVTLMCPRD